MSLGWAVRQEVRMFGHAHCDVTLVHHLLPYQPSKDCSSVTCAILDLVYVVFRYLYVYVQHTLVIRQLEEIVVSRNTV